MKKVLFATSALIATASVAAADVSLSGGGRFGIVYDNGKRFGVSSVAPFSKTKIERRMTINIDGSGSTDGGMEFGGRIRLRSDEGDAAGGISSSNVYFGNDMFRITVGNTDGAALNRVNFFQGSVGLTGLGYRNVSFNIGSNSWVLNSYSSRGNTGDVVRLDFNTGGFGVSLSTSSTGDNLSNGHQDGLAASYNFGDWTVAAAYTKNTFAAPTAVGTAAAANSMKVMSLSVAGSIGDFGVGLGYSDQQYVGNKVVLNGSYNFGDTSVTAFVAKTSEDAVGSAGIGAAGSETEYGIGFTHSLGGATLAGGIVKDYRKSTVADLGVRFSF